MIVSQVSRSLPPCARHGVKPSAPATALSLALLVGLLLMLFGVAAPAKAQTAPVITSAYMDAPNGPGITVSNPRQVGLTITGSWSTAGLKVLLNGYPCSYFSDPNVQALHIALPSFMAPGAAAVKIVNNYGTSAQIGFYATPPLVRPGQVTAVRNADQSVTLTFYVFNTTQPAQPGMPYKGCYAPGVMITSASLGAVTVNHYFTVGNLATNLTLGKESAGPFKLTFPASVGAKGTSVWFSTSGEYGDSSYHYPSPTWGGRYIGGAALISCAIQACVAATLPRAAGLSPAARGRLDGCT